MQDFGKTGTDIPAFFITQEKVRIRRKATVKIKLQYAPITFEIHRCNLVFTDESVGELQYEVIGIPNHPLSIDTLKIQTYVDSQTPAE